MPLIRNIKIQNIKDTIISSELFSINDFKFDFPEEGNVLALITLRGSSKYSFAIEETFLSNGIFDFQHTLQNKSREKVIRTVQCPGDNKNYEVYTHQDIDDCINKIHYWLINLDEDLKSIDIFDNINDINNIEEFEKKLDEQFPNENEKFTEEEKENLLEKINQLQKRIETLEKNANTENQIQILEESKIELNSYPKKTWYLKIYNKLTNVNNGFILVNELKDNISKFLENLNI